MNRVSEASIVAVLIATFCLVSFLTLENAPHPWGDEPGYTDPAVNLATGGGFKSATWYAQGSDQFFAGNVPLHQVTLAAWIKTFGFGVWEVRSINVVWVGLATALLWVFTLTSGALHRPMFRIVFVLLFLGSAGIDMATRLGRPDGITIALVAAALAASQIRVATLRGATLVALGFLFPLAGLQITVFAALFCGLLLIFAGFRFLLDSLALGLGVLIGVLSLIVLYWLADALPGFIASVLPHSGGGGSSTSKFSGFVSDPSLWLLWAAAGTSLATAGFSKSLQLRSLLGFGVACLVLVPIGMVLLGKFSHHYTWMVFIPGLVGVLSAMETRSFPKPISALVASLLGLSAILGVPKTLALVVRDEFPRPADRVAEWLDGKVSQGDFVFCDMSAYYAVKPVAGRTFTRFYLDAIRRDLAPVGEIEQINLLIIVPENKDETTDLLPGRWDKIDEKAVFAIPGLRRSTPFTLQIWKKST